MRHQADDTKDAMDFRVIRTQTAKDTIRRQATKTKDKDINSQTTKDTMRRHDTKNKDAIGPQGNRDIRTQTTKDTLRHQDTKRRTPLDFRDDRTQTTKDTMRRQATKTKDAIGLQGHQDTNNEGHPETPGHGNEGLNWNSGTSGHKPRRTR